MAFCAQCGARVPDGAANCPACGAAAEPEQYTQPVPPARRSDSQPPRHTNTQQTRYRDSQQSRYSDNQPPRRDSQQTTREYSEMSERPASRPAANMCLAENEKVVRQYQCTDIRHPKAAGYLAVTNKRVIFYGRGSSSRVVKEVVLDSVSGIDCFYGMDIRVGRLVFGVILAILGIVLKSGIDDMFYGNRGTPALLLTVIGVLLVALSLRKCFYLSIFSSKANGSPISIGGQPRNVLGNGALYTLTSRPTQDTDRMLSELGALIQDLQTMGDHAIDKWKNKK